MHKVLISLCCSVNSVNEELGKIICASSYDRPRKIGVLHNNKHFCSHAQKRGLQPEEL